MIKQAAMVPGLKVRVKHGPGSMGHPQFVVKDALTGRPPFCFWTDPKEMGPSMHHLVDGFDLELLDKPKRVARDCSFKAVKVRTPIGQVGYTYLSCVMYDAEVIP